MNTNPLDQPGKLFHVELLNPNPTGRKTKEGPIYRVSFEVDKDTYDLFMDGRSNIRLYAKMCVVSDTEEEQQQIEQSEKPSKPKPSRGPYGKFYQTLFKNGFQYAPQTKVALDLPNEATEQDVKEALYKLFEVKSLTELDPSRFCEWAAEKGLASLIPKNL